MSASANMYTLIGLGVLTAFVFSLAATFAPSWFPATMRDAQGMVRVLLNEQNSHAVIVIQLTDRLKDFLDVKRCQPE